MFFHMTEKRFIAVLYKVKPTLILRVGFVIWTISRKCGNLLYDRLFKCNSFDSFFLDSKLCAYIIESVNWKKLWKLSATDEKKAIPMLGLICIEMMSMLVVPDVS